LRQHTLVKKTALLLLLLAASSFAQEKKRPLLDEPGARSAAFAFLHEGPAALYPDLAPSDLESATVTREENHWQGPIFRFVTPRFAVVVAASDGTVVAFSRCRECYRLAPSLPYVHHSTRFDEFDKAEASAKGFLEAHYPSTRDRLARGRGGGSSSAGSHISVSAVLAVSAPGQPADECEVTLTGPSYEVSALVWRDDAATVGSVAISKALAAANAHAALEAFDLAHDVHNIQENEPRLTMSRAPATGERRAYYVVVTGLFPRTTNDGFTEVYVDAMTGEAVLDGEGPKMVLASELAEKRRETFLRWSLASVVVVLGFVLGVRAWRALRKSPSPVQR
jgi:hypothetical protein